MVRTDQPTGRMLNLQYQTRAQNQGTTRRQTGNNTQPWPIGPSFEALVRRPTDLGPRFFPGENAGYPVSFVYSYTKADRQVCYGR
jgi:hypothetical protein